MATYNGKVINGSLNLRKTASKSSTALASIPNGTSLVVSEYQTDPTWYCTTYNGNSGFVMAQYVQLGTALAYESATVINGNLNFRKYPDKGAGAYCQINNGTNITVQRHNSTWCSTTYNGNSGFVMTQFLNIGGSTGGSTGDGGTLVFGTVFDGCWAASINNDIPVRMEPSTSSEKVDAITGAQPYQCGTFSGKWSITQQQEWLRYMAPHGGRPGYVLAKSIGLWNSNDTNAYISGSGVNFRTGPSTNSSVIDLLQKNERVMILSYTDNWYRVTCSKGTGWVYSSYVTRD